jgi:hypothetical protein
MDYFKHVLAQQLNVFNINLTNIGLINNKH